MPKTDGTYTVLQLINENKDVLFKKSVDFADRENKITEWRKILRISQMLNIIPNSKDYTFLRDVFWESLKKSAVKRHEAQVRGKPITLTQSDLIILEILAKGDPQNKTKNSGIIAFPTKNILKSTTRYESIQAFGKDADHKKVKKSGMGDECAMDEEEYVYDPADEQLQLERRLEIEFLELKTYRLKLELLELEHKFKLEPSEFTLMIKTDNRIPIDDILCDTLERKE